MCWIKKILKSILHGLGTKKHQRYQKKSCGEAGA